MRSEQAQRTGIATPDGTSGDYGAEGETGPAASAQLTPGSGRVTLRVGGGDLNSPPHPATNGDWRQEPTNSGNWRRPRRHLPLAAIGKPFAERHPSVSVSGALGGENAVSV